MKKILPLITMLFLLWVNCTAQNNPDLKRTWHWYFGYNAGLDFSSGAPVAVTDGQMSVWKGSATMSDTAGNLLFYTDGERVWNKNHQLMPNGNYLINSYGRVQPTQVLAVPKPGSNNLYYIFYTQFGTQLHTYVELVYAIVDMSQQGGMGDVISKQNHILNGVTERITAIPRNKNSDIWIITMKFQTNSFYTYLLTSSGIDTIPHGVYNLGKVDNIGLGSLKPSLDGTKLAAEFCTTDFTVTGGIELLDFEKSSGIISNPLVFPSCYCESYGIQFSPDGTKLYSAVHYTGTYGFEAGNAIYQYDLSVNDSASIINSKTLLDSVWVVDTITWNPVRNFCYALQIGSDGKIYGSQDQVAKLRVINNPNLPGVACNYIDSAVDLSGRRSYRGFPEFMSNYFYNNTSSGISEKNFNIKIIQVYPNPFVNYATIEIAESNINLKTINIEAYDFIGKKYQIDYSVISNTDENLKLSVSAGKLTSGLYFIKISINQKIYTQKVIIIKN